MDIETENRPGRAVDGQGETYDLIVVGAGICGLNVLDAARDYLPQGARVLLLDQKRAAGGMWNIAYDYVALHQPHPMFTVGNMTWDWAKPNGYLARRDEVQAHLARGLEPAAAQFALETGFEQTVCACDEIETDQGPRVQITYHPNDAPDACKTVLAHRAVHAAGLDYRLAEPLALSSAGVVSIIPQDLQQTLKAHPGAAVVVVGGGKTGMDSALAVLREDPGRTVSMIHGRGTNFVNRNKFFPTGIRRWVSGMLLSRLFREVALSFDGSNEDRMLEQLRARHTTDPEAVNGVFLFGLQSEEEHAEISAGLKQSLPGYLVDVEDGAAGPQMALRSGEHVAVAEGTIFVNCTGSFFRGSQMAERQPFLSPSGTVMRINTRDGFHFLTSVGGFFATHLLYRDAMRGRGFFTLDHEALFRKNRNAWVGAASAQAYMHQAIAVQTLPLSVLDRCGLDLDRWYPLPHRLIGLQRMKQTARADIAHCRNVLEHTASRCDIGLHELV